MCQESAVQSDGGSVLVEVSLDHTHPLLHPHSSQLPMLSSPKRALGRNKLIVSCHDKEDEELENRATEILMRVKETTRDIDWTTTPPPRLCSSRSTWLQMETGIMAAWSQKKAVSNEKAPASLNSSLISTQNSR
ncbi:hypothetical protein EYF80_039188 [Liparis tanakae]|uniref:Uncharacterized protein n=1 Tax=Liparis tanakae TaxID=230148 RepID=A0A4Z2GD29_9TELE|nr:hypothetical protein EYF80_039188 [Liparis tanakae]